MNKCFLVSTVSLHFNIWWKFNLNRFIENLKFEEISHRKQDDQDD